MSSKSSSKKLEGFFTGKGFYIVLFLCAAVIGVSAWMMAAGNETMASDVTVNDNRLDSDRVETVIIPPAEEQEVRPVDEITDEPIMEVQAPEVNTEGVAEAVEPVPEIVEVGVWREGDVLEVSGSVYSWPVNGELERGHSMESLAYDVTMRDWRTHDGIDITAELGTTVLAARSGTVVNVMDDDFYGTTVIIDHGDGVKTVYSNLADVPTVRVGDQVEGGTVIGAIGDTALCESGQSAHLHFEVEADGKAADPLAYLPG